MTKSTPKPSLGAHYHQRTGRSTRQETGETCFWGTCLPPWDRSLGRWSSEKSKSLDGGPLLSVRTVDGGGTSLASVVVIVGRPLHSNPLRELGLWSDRIDPRWSLVAVAERYQMNQTVRFQETTYHHDSSSPICLFFRMRLQGHSQD